MLMLLDKNGKEFQFLQNLPAIIAITGAGGKTSLLFSLARLLGRHHRVLVTTTTKIFKPDFSLFQAVDCSGFVFTDRAITAPGMYLAGIPVDKGKKLGSPSLYQSLKEQHNFDVILIEADGAAQKPLKGWRKDEPVIPEGVTATVAVVDIQSIGKIASPQWIHRFELFCLQSGCSENEVVTGAHLHQLIVADNGYFQHSRGQKILFFNKVERPQDREAAAVMIKMFHGMEYCVCYGSLHRGEIYVCDE